MAASPCIVNEKGLSSHARLAEKETPIEIGPSRFYSPRVPNRWDIETIEHFGFYQP
jgi:hypothetical protein